MSDLRTAAQQALAFTMRDFASLRDFEASKAVLHDNLRAALAEPVQEQAEPIAWLQPKTMDAHLRPDLGYEACSSADYGAFPVYRVPPRCPNCASLEAQNNELDRKLAEMERAHGIIESEIKGDSRQTLDEAMRLPRAMAQAYENGYKAGAAAERKRIIQFLTEMQRQVGDGHNYYGVAAMRIREMV